MRTEPGTMLNLSKKFVVFHMRPPDSGEPFLVNGIAYRHTLPLYLILEIAMTCVGCPGAFDEQSVAVLCKFARVSPQTCMSQL
jgi:hypothetical protein